MKQNSEAERDSNVIKLSFKSDYDANQVPHDIAHPASKNYLEEDPLHQLLHEFDELVDEVIDEPEIEEFIFHHQKAWDYQVSYDDDLRMMGDTISEQIKRLKEDAKRLKYYLDEMNLD